MSLLNLLIIGHGSQAKAWGENLKLSGAEVTYALRESSNSFEAARENGQKVIVLKEIDKKSCYDAILLLTPDHTHLPILIEISDQLAHASKIVYAHGFSIDKENIHQKFPHFSHLLLAPKAIASEVTKLYSQNKPVPAAFSLERSLSPAKDMQLIHDIAAQVGMNGTLVQTTFREETICDLFSEQSILCSTLPRIIKASYDTLVKNGVSQELAFLECCLESKYILNTLLEVGFSKFFEIISPNALVGAKKATERLFDDQFFHQFETLFKDIESGQFYQEIESSDIDTFRKKMVSLYSEGDIEKTRKSLKEYLE
jgi:ketol-acid reductoisomerase